MVIRTGERRSQIDNSHQINLNSNTFKCSSENVTLNKIKFIELVFREQSRLDQLKKELDTTIYQS